MEILLWLAILLAVGIVLWLAAPYHHRMIGNRDTELGNPGLLVEQVGGAPTDLSRGLGHRAIITRCSAEKIWLAPETTLSR